MCCLVGCSHTLEKQTQTKTLCFKCLNSSSCFHFSLSGLVVPVDEEHSSHLILGVLLTLRYLMPLLQQQAPNTSLKGSFGLVRKEADVTPTPEQLIQVSKLMKFSIWHWYWKLNFPGSPLTKAKLDFSGFIMLVWFFVCCCIFLYV